MLGRYEPQRRVTKNYGVGGMRGHIPYDGTRVVAMCDVDTNHLNEAAALVKDKITFINFQVVILVKNVDVVHIGDPPHWHGIMAVEAAKAGGYLRETHDHHW